jgi:hypothetical protein
MARTKKPVVTYPTKLVFAAACAADRINEGEYIPVGTVLTVEAVRARIVKDTNKSLMLNLLSKPESITEEDHAKALLVMQNYQALTFKILNGKVLKEFESKAMDLASAETLQERDIGVVAYLPVGYARAMKIRTAEQRLQDCDVGFCGAVGSKVSLNIEVLKIVFSQNYNCHFVSAITKDNLAVSFATSHGSEYALNQTYNVTAKVKAHFEGSVTKLNFVKLVKNA